MVPKSLRLCVGMFTILLALAGCSGLVTPRVGMHSALLAPRWTHTARAAVRLADVLVGTEQDMITITPGAMAQLVALKESHGSEVVLRMGVRSGGCSGMSYVMDMIAADAIDEQDLVIEYAEQGLRCVIDPKSSMFLYGLQLDYSNKLIGGGFGFKARAALAFFAATARAPPLTRCPSLRAMRVPPGVPLTATCRTRRCAESERRVDVRLRLLLQRLSDGRNPHCNHGCVFSVISVLVNHVSTCRHRDPRFHHPPSSSRRRY